MMTCRNKLKLEHPKAVVRMFRGGCKGCPSDYGYLGDPPRSDGKCIISCRACWDREIPEEVDDDARRDIRFI